ncbi:hypothetical protein [Bilophila wadsworthia]|uniref:hypothetical protein n=1 Tax=Bilophila wadsworthia TaxID=35833 RepID=UPI002A81695C|nr:hypothetical protein [Bilophila wadsworthia]MDY3682381.1 hypothetical protein [Bilophila wadsworthia]
MNCCAIVTDLFVSPAGKRIRIFLRFEDGSHRVASLTPDEVRNRDIREGDSVVVTAEASGRLAVLRPVLELRPANAEAFV